MRHANRINQLGRKSAHRKAMLSNMASSLILHKRINTTLAKAKELRKYVEPLITKAKSDTTHSRRTVFSYLQNKESVKELFNDVAERCATRPGGYTRILKVGNRLGDNAEMCIIELVDYNETMLEATSAKSKTRRSRRRRGSGKGKSEDKAQTQTQAKESKQVEEQQVEEQKPEKEEQKPEEEQQTSSATESPAVEEEKNKEPENKEPEKAAESKSDSDIEAKSEEEKPDEEKKEPKKGGEEDEDEEKK